MSDLVKNMDFSGNDIVIGQRWGGLGDNLQFSTLAEEFFNQGKKVYLSSRNVCRTQEVYDLVWGANPYISGISDEPENAGQCREPEYLQLANIPNFMSRWERAHGLPGKNIIPKIYYQPKVIDELLDKYIIDMGSTTTSYTKDGLMNFLHTFQKFTGANQCDFLQVTFPNRVAGNSIDINGVDKILVRDIFHYCDVINSVKGFSTVFSGACHLASAIRKDRDRPAIHCLVEAQYYNVGFFQFPNVRYYVAT